MSSLAGPFHAVALLLLVAGVAKAGRPSGTVAALASAGLPARRSLAQALGAVEVAVAVAALAVGGLVPAIAVAVLHLSFAAFALRLLAQRGPAASCGCFGSAGAPVTMAHVVTTGAAALIALGATVTGVGGLTAAVGDTPLAGVPYLALVVGLAAVVHLCLTALPELQLAARTVAADGVDR